MINTSNPNELTIIGDRKVIERAYLKRELIMFISAGVVSFYHIRNSIQADDGFWPYGLTIYILLCLFIKAVIKTFSLYTVIMFRKIDASHIDITYKGMRTQTLDNESISFESNTKTNILRILINGEKADWMFLSAFQDLEEKYSHWISTPFDESVKCEEEVPPTTKPLSPLAQIKEAFLILLGKKVAPVGPSDLSESQIEAQKKVNKLFAFWKLMMMLIIPLFLLYSSSLLVLQDLPQGARQIIALPPTCIIFFILHKLFYVLHGITIGPIAILGQKILDKAKCIERGDK